MRPEKVYKADGVPWSEKKAQIKRKRGSCIGSQTMNTAGRIRPAIEKFFKWFCMTVGSWKAPKWNHKLAAAIARLVCFNCQYRRASFVLAHELWKAVFGEGGGDWQRSEAEDGLSGLIMSAPLMHIDHRAPCSEIMSVSDAPEKGGAVPSGHYYLTDRPTDSMESTGNLPVDSLESVGRSVK
jgi:hypothetical protein